MLTYILQTLHNFEREDPKNMDPEAYYRLVLITRGIAVSRPQNLSNFEFIQQEGNLRTSEFTNLKSHFITNNN